MALEDAIAQVQILKSGLSAEKEIDEEAGHYETTTRYPHEGRHFRYYDMQDDPYEVEEWVSDGYTGKKIQVPDTARRQHAKNELKKIFDSSKVHYARVEAGKALGYSKLKILLHEIIK